MRRLAGSGLRSSSEILRDLVSSLCVKFHTADDDSGKGSGQRRQKNAKTLPERTPAFDKGRFRSILRTV